MTVSEITKKMIDFLDGSRKDVRHFLKVHAYAKIIGELENLDEKTQLTLEVAAIVHDIACPLCREKYGSSRGKNQEIEGMPLAREFLSDTELDGDIIDRVVYLVGHHHTIDMVDGVDYRILLEADYLVNADESNYTPENIENTRRVMFKTKTGTELLNSIYKV